MSKKTTFISRVLISILLLPGLNSVASSQTGNSILGFNLTRKDQNRLSQFEKVVEQLPTRDSLKETLVSLEKAILGSVEESRCQVLSEFSFRRPC
jgi:hypothetical protein